MEIEARDEQQENADSLKMDMTHPLSKVIAKRLLHLEKHDFEMIATDEGI
jgi:hypothetical protein